MERELGAMFSIVVVVGCWRFLFFETRFLFIVRDELVPVQGLFLLLEGKVVWRSSEFFCLL